MIKKLLCFLSFIAIHFSIFSQEFPPINIFSTEDYGAENQNWSITQSNNRFIYVANNKGLLEYNGANWHLYTTPNETIMRSVKFFDDKIYTGFYMDFGYWQKNDFGILKFTSLVEENNINMLEDEQIWEIVELDGWLLFKSLQRIYLYNIANKEIKIINSDNNIIKLSKVNNTVYFQEIEKGIFMIENGVPKLVSDHQELKKNKVVDIFIKDNNLLFITQKSGFFILNNGVLKKWSIPSDAILSTKTIYSAAVLKNKDFVLGTISSGLLYLKENGEFDYQITQELGLTNNTVLSLYEDVESNLWLGLDNGINSLNLTSPFKIYSKKNNFWGTIYTTILHNDNLYLGTNQGLYYRKQKSEDDFELIKGTEGQVWNLQEINKTLFCSHDSGTYIINGSTANLIKETSGTWGLEKINDSIILQGTYSGLEILSKENNQWSLRNKIEGFSNSSRYFLIRDSNRIFVNHEYKGVFKIEVDEDFKKVLNIKKVSSVEKGIHSSLIEYQNKILYSCKRGVYIYNKEKDIFELDSLYSKLLPEEKFLSAKLIANHKENKLWSFTKDDIRYITPGVLSSEPSLHIVPIKGSLHKGATGYENIINLEDKTFLIGTSNGFFTVDLNKIKNITDFEVHINKVYSSKIDEFRSVVKLSEKAVFSATENNIEFYYSVPNYNKTSSIKYQYKIDGFNEKWSQKSNKNSFLLENLPSGEFTFKLRASIDNTFSTNIASYSFKVLKPWYSSFPFILIYFLLLLSLLFAVQIVTKRYYKKQREELLDKKQKELELKELESSQKIIKLNNDKLRSDIESKNRELATSTMSIIKKNEFLNNIKNELSSGGKENINKVIKIIDNNLNNTDDWKMFQEAFNNADKNFIKKVKSIHPELTPNDLRLCAYLRLNLTSKEISPLLNISPRSVEVKRYRLRKKMNLEHDANLTDYIINL